MSGYYKAKPTSRIKIRAFAKTLRKLLGLENAMKFPMVEVFEILSTTGLFNYEICTKHEMGNKCGETIPSQKLIKIREDIYDLACNGDPFSISTLAHELYHLFHHHEESVSFCRKEDGEIKRKAYEDPEWQANCFAGELLVDKDLVKGLTVEEIQEKTGASWTMSNYQLSQYMKEDGEIGT